MDANSLNASPPLKSTSNHVNANSGASDSHPVPSSPASAALPERGGRLAKLTDAYTKFFLTNISSYTHLDTSIKAVLWLAPGRYGDSEAMIEGTYSILGLWNLAHDLIVQKEEAKLNPENPQLVPAEIASYVTGLTVLNNIELFSEIIIQSKLGSEKKWPFILALEGLKAYLKLGALQKNAGRPVTTQYIPSYRDVISSRKPVKKTQHRLRREIAPEKWVQFKANFQKSMNGLLNRPSNNAQPTMTQVLLEMVHILRPVFYVISIIRNGKESWRPWLLSFVLETVPVLFSFTSFPSLTPKERQEINRRFGLLLYYILRSPFFEALSRLSPDALKRGIARLQTVPLIGTLMVSLIDYVDYYRDHYFCISGT